MYFLQVKFSSITLLNLRWDEPRFEGEFPKSSRDAGSPDKKGWHQKDIEFLLHFSTEKNPGSSDKYYWNLLWYIAAIEYFDNTLAQRFCHPVDVHPWSFEETLNLPEYDGWRGTNQFFFGPGNPRWYARKGVKLPTIDVSGKHTASSGS